MNCPCGFGKDYEKCCKPYIEEGKKVPNVEFLMRSRYTAFTMKNMTYILETSLNDTVNEKNIKALEREFESVDWLELIVLESAHDSVEFKAYFRVFDGPIEVLHEHSLFTQKDGKWYYRDGTIFKAKIERNQPCPCGSGEKYKNCCAKR